MTTRDLIHRHASTIRTAHRHLLSHLAKDDNRPDEGVMEDVFRNNARLGRISRGDDAKLQEAFVYAVTGVADLSNTTALAAADAWFALRHEEYISCEDTLTGERQ